MLGPIPVRSIVLPAIKMPSQRFRGLHFGSMKFPVQPLTDLFERNIGPVHVSLGYGDMTRVKADAQVLFFDGAYGPVIGGAVKQSGGTNGMRLAAKKYNKVRNRDEIYVVASGSPQANSPNQIHLLSRTRAHPTDTESMEALKSNFFRLLQEINSPDIHINSLVVGISEGDNQYSKISPLQYPMPLLFAISDYASIPGAKPLQITFVDHNNRRDSRYRSNSATYYAIETYLMSVGH